MPTLDERRRNFNRELAPRLAAQVGVTQRWPGTGSRRFAYFVDDQRFVVVTGDQETTQADLALVYGLSWRDGRKLVLILPEGRVHPTLQRAPWLTASARPEVYVHARERVERRELRSRDQTVEEVCARLKPGQLPAEEFAYATQPLHLGKRSRAVSELVEWAASHPLLDPAHRRSERSWHCRGQRVLRINGTREGLRVTAGIHHSGDNAPAPLLLPLAQTLSDQDLAAIRASAGTAIQRRTSGDFHKPDEHWLQAVIRREPELVGIEQPALREVPAWRPKADGRLWARSYLDLAGLDSHGNIRVVETKLANNTDDLFAFQGLDYYIWARAYHQVLRDRLGAPRRAGIELHYVIGASTTGRVHVSRHVQEHAALLDVPWRAQVVRDWFRPPRPERGGRSERLADGMIAPDQA